MAEQTAIIMTIKDLQRYDIVKNLINGNINGTEASKQLNLSIRQTKRLKIKVKRYGAKGIIHGNRGKPSNRKISEKKKERIKQIITEKYYDFGPTFALEKLKEEYNIKDISDETLRQLMIAWKLWKPRLRRQTKKKHVWRARKDNYGEMEQFDGSYHNWFGNEETCLLLSIDDASGKITNARFDYDEGVIAVFKFWKEYIEKNGIPVSIYLDRFSTYKVNHKNAVDNKDMITQFQRVSQQTGFKLIFANSPQAKGRIERLNKTLQDRLVKELRLANISTMDEANEFLENYIPKFNAQFAVIPRRKIDIHKEINQTLKQKLSQIFSIQDQRKIMNDYTIRFENRYFQLNQEQTTTVYKKDTVIVEKHLDNDIKINFKGHYLDYTVLPERPKKEIDVKLLALTTKKQSDWKPPLNHPWRRQFFVSRQNTNKQYQLNNN